MAKDTGAETTNVISVDDEGWETLVEEYGENWVPEKEGDELVGVYQGSKTLEQPDLNNPGQMRDTTVYEVTDAAGKKWSVWSNYNVDIAFADVGTGDTVKLVFMGKIPLDGGKTVNTYRILRKKK